MNQTACEKSSLIQAGEESSETSDSLQITQHYNPEDCTSHKTLTYNAPTFPRIFSIIYENLEQ